MKKYFSGLHKNVILHSLSSLFGDISSEMLYPILPIYLTQNLKASGSVVGLIEGIAQATQNMVQGVSGYLSDKWRQRKLLAIAGYILAAVCKPFIGLASNWHQVMLARFSAIVGLSGLIASIIAGRLWDNVGHSAVFKYGSLVSFPGIIAVYFLIPRSGSKTE